MSDLNEEDLSKYNAADPLSVFNQVLSEMGEGSSDDVEEESTDEKDLSNSENNINTIELDAEDVSEEEEDTRDSQIDFGLVEETDTKKDDPLTAKLEAIALTVQKQEERAAKAELKQIEDNLQYAKNLRKDAIEQGNVDLVSQYDDYIDSLKEAKKVHHTPTQVKKESTQQQLHPEEEAFLARNSSWAFSSHPKALAIQAYTRGRVGEIVKTQPNLQPKQIFSIVEKEIITNFGKSKSQQQTSTKSSANIQAKTGGATQTSSKAEQGKISVKDLSSEDRGIYNSLPASHRDTFLQAVAEISKESKTKR